MCLNINYLVKSSTASTGHLGTDFCGFPNMFCRLTHTEGFLFIISIYPRLSVTTNNLKECSKENTGSPLPALTTLLWLSIKMHLTSIAEFVHLVNGRRDNMKHLILKNNKKNISEMQNRGLHSKMRKAACCTHFSLSFFSLPPFTPHVLVNFYTNKAPLYLLLLSVHLYIHTYIRQMWQYFSNHFHLISFIKSFVKLVF